MFINILVYNNYTEKTEFIKIRTREQGGVGGDGNPIVTKSCLDAIKVKHQKWLKYKYCMTSSNYFNYKSARNKVTSELRKAKYNYEKDLSTRINNDNKIFWTQNQS